MWDEDKYERRFSEGGSSRNRNGVNGGYEEVELRWQQWKARDGVKEGYEGRFGEGGSTEGVKEG